MMHGVSLHGTNDSIELQVFADGVSRGRFLGLSKLTRSTNSCRPANQRGSLLIE